jgi:hypothetical protein
MGLNGLLSVLLVPIERGSVHLARSVPSNLETGLQLMSVASESSDFELKLVEARLGSRVFLESTHSRGPAVSVQIR